jgi:hypothetical protein
MNYNADTGGSDVVHNQIDFVGENADLAHTNGASWCRNDGTIGRRFKLVRVPKNKNITRKNVSWTPTSAEWEGIREQIDRDACDYPQLYGNGNTIVGMFSFGKRDTPANKRPEFRADIKRHYQKGPCVVTGTHSDIEVDHKNSLCNDPRVANHRTQRLSDAQSFSKHINDVKRSAGVRQSAYEIPMLKAFADKLQLPPYIQGESTYDETDPNATVGTFWHDPVAFLEGWADIILDRIAQRES